MGANKQILGGELKFSKPRPFHSGLKDASQTTNP